MLCCPRCGGTDVFLETGGYTGTIYRCKKCGYRGSFIVEVDDDRDRNGKKDERPSERRRG
jgi:transposase-like protein